MEQECSGWSFFSIWVKPKQTIRRIVESCANYKLWILSGVYGLQYMFWISQFFSFTHKIPLWGTIVLAAVLAFPAGYIVINISSWFMWWISKLLGGHAPFKHVRAAFAWSNFPNIINIVIWIVLIIAFGNQVFMQGFPGNMPSNVEMLPLLRVGVLIQTVIGVWMLVLLVLSLGEVSGYSAWMGLLNVILSVIIIAVLFYGGGYLVQKLILTGVGA